MSFNNVNVNVSGPVQPTSTYKTKVLKGNHSFASQVTEPNTKYVIKHDFDLGGESVIPANCVLEFDGGSLRNGSLLGDYVVDAPFGKQIVDNVALNQEMIYASWYGIFPRDSEYAESDNSEKLEFAVNNSLANRVKVVFDYVGYYDFYSPIVFTHRIELTSIQTDRASATARLAYNTSGDQTFITLRKNRHRIHNLQFVGINNVVGERPNNNYVGTTLIKIQSAEEPDNTNDELNNNDSYINNCGFTQCKTAIYMTGRQWTIRDCQFSKFGNGIVIADLNTEGSLGGSSRRNRIIGCKFDDSNPQSKLGQSPGTYINMLAWNDSLVEAYSCINNKSIVSNTLFITDCYNSSFNSFYRGRLQDSIIANNVSVYTFREMLWLSDVINSTINGNSFLCCRTYTDGMRYKGANQGICILGDCINSAICDNVIQGAQWGGIFMKAGTEPRKFVGNSITGNSFYLCGVTRYNPYVIYLGQNTIKSNIISENSWKTNKDNIIFSDENERLVDFIYAQADGEYNVYNENVIINNFGDRYNIPTLNSVTKNLLLSVIDSDEKQSYLPVPSVASSQSFFMASGKRYRFAELRNSNENGFFLIITSQNYYSNSKSSFNCLLVGLAGRNATKITNIKSVPIINNSTYDESSRINLYKDNDYIYIGTSSSAGMDATILPLSKYPIIPVTEYDISELELESIPINFAIGSNSQKPTFSEGEAKGYCYFNTVLNKPIWWNGSAWVDATGATV